MSRASVLFIIAIWLLSVPLLLTAAPSELVAGRSFGTVAAAVQPCMVKIYGAGGYRGLEAYQSGFLVADDGHIATVWSYVLDTDHLTVVLHDGRKFDAKLLAADPVLELAVLKIEAAGLTHFDLKANATADVGSRVLAFSNLFNVATGDEPVSVQHGTVAVRAPLAARRGAYESPYRGPAYILDAMTNNPGAAGGALTDRRGRLLGMLGKELKNSQNDTWLNYAIPISELRTTIDEICRGRYVRRPPAENVSLPKSPHTGDNLGLILVPDVLERTPPYLDAVRFGSPANRAGLKPDDLIVFVNDRLVASCKALLQELRAIDRIDPVRLTILRNQELVDVSLSAEESR